MIRRTFARKSLIAALALVMAAAPSIAQAAGPAPRYCPLQFKNWTGETLYNVTITHYYGLENNTYHFDAVPAGGAVFHQNPILFYTSGAKSASYWTVTGHFEDYDLYMVYRSLDRYDLTGVDAGVPLTIIISTDGVNTGLGSGQSLSYYSNNGSRTGLPMAFYD